MVSRPFFDYGVKPTVGGGGRITAKAKGTCWVYVYAHNGVSKGVKVTVH